MRFFYIITSDQWLSAGSIAERVFFTTTRAIVGNVASFTDTQKLSKNSFHVERIPKKWAELISSSPCIWWSGILAGPCCCAPSVR